MQSEYNKRYTPREAKLKIAKYCAYQERCHQEVRDKLYTYGLAKEDVELIIYELIEQDFLNEERFALAYVRGKFRHKKWGRTKITLELKRRKISAYCIKKGMREIDEDDYLKTLDELIAKKIASQKAIKHYQKCYKAVQYVMTKGYESDLAWNIIKSKYAV